MEDPKYWLELALAIGAFSAGMVAVIRRLDRINRNISVVPKMKKRIVKHAARLEAHEERLDEHGRRIVDLENQ